MVYSFKSRESKRLHFELSCEKMMKQEANIYAIAKEAGVSIATVSRVVNNTGSVSDRSRQRVLEAVNKTKK